VYDLALALIVIGLVLWAAGIVWHLWSRPARDMLHHLLDDL